MKLKAVLEWIDGVLETGKFDDVSNNGLQIGRRSDEVRKVAFAVDASLASVRDAAAAGADLLVVHHGISWGGGLKRVTGSVYDIVRTAVEADLALAGYHLPLDANERVGNNFELAREMRLTAVEKAFNYHGNVIGLVGTAPDVRRIGVCSGGAGAFAPEAKELGCDLYVTGEADWGEVIAAENAGMAMECRGHYETETRGVSALMRLMRAELGIETVFISRRSEGGVK